MAKAPLAGTVKTRLAPALTASGAAALHACFLRDMAANVADVAGHGHADGLVVYTPVGAEAAFDGILPKVFKLLAQRGESLGDRLCNATEDLLKDGYGAVCLINSDSPTLPRALLERAVGSLAQEGDRVLLGAADDGGYYLIGLKQAHRNLFDRIAWSTAEVLAHTIERANEIGLPVELLPRWYDVDDAATLQHLCDELFATEQRDGAYPAPHTKEFLASIIEKESAEHLCSKLAPYRMKR
jgi:hypothetical protein